MGRVRGRFQLVRSNYSNPIYGRKWARANEVDAEFGAATYLSTHLDDAGGSEPHLDVSIVVPLLNEEENIELALSKPG
jgi:hypothetical protein